jgi:DNA-binding MarR family transcriptional regulator
VVLTQEGQSLKDTLLPAARSVAFQAVDGFEEAEILMLIGLLQRLTANLS